MEKEYLTMPNPDFIKRKKIEESIKENDGYCITVMQHNEDNKCICSEFRNQQHSGFCKCGLYYKTLHLPKVCLCGSAKFKQQFFETALNLSLEGYEVSLPLMFVKENIDKLSKEEKEYFNEIYKTRIAEADLIYIINYNKYIGDSTREEILWAQQLGKKIKYLEN